MVIYRLIGKGTTDSSGVARMTQKTTDGGSTWSSTSGYTGVGKGEVDFVASLDLPLLPNSLQSEPYEVLDSIIYIKGDTVTSNLTTNASIALSVEDDFVKMTPSASNKWQSLNVNSSSNYLNPSNNYKAEFDFIIPTTDYCLFSICGANLRINWGTATEEHHAKVELIDGVAKIYIDENTTASGSANVGSGTDCSFGLYNLTYLKVKNFKLYPI